MVMKPASVIEMARANFQSFQRQRKHAERIDHWIKGTQLEVEDARGLSKWGGKPFLPDGRDLEFDDLIARGSNPFAGLVVSSLAQTAYLDGMRMPNSTDNLRSWDIWQENRMDARQIPLHRATIGHGVAFVVARRGASRLGGAPTAIYSGYSALRMAAFYDEEEGDEFPRFAMLCDPIPKEVDPEGGWYVRIIDEEAEHYLSCRSEGLENKDWTYISYDEHRLGVCPVVRYANRIDLDGATMGVVEPVIPILRRLDQTTFDRLVVQRFGAWKVRYIAGMTKPKTPGEAMAAAVELRIQDLLVSENKDTKFGTLDETQIKGFIESGDADLRYLSAVAQIPPHHLLGLSSNLQAEALATAESGLQRQSDDFRTINGESHESLTRLGAFIAGYAEEARAFDMQARWRDTESRSLIQAANALSVVATGLKVPVELLWERIPGWTDLDSERAKALVEDGTFEQLLAALGANDPATPAQARAGGADQEPTI